MPDELLIGHVGRYDPIKRQADLIDAARLLQSAQPLLRFHIVLVGAGPTENELRMATADLSYVSLLPPTRDVPAILRDLDLLVLCSAHEGAPRILLEAMAVGLPIISTNVGGIPSLVGDRAALLVPPYSPAKLADAISTLANDLKKRARMGACTSHHVRTFSADREWSEFRALYDSILPP